MRSVMLNWSTSFWNILRRFMQCHSTHNAILYDTSCGSVDFSTWIFQILGMIKPWWVCCGRANKAMAVCSCCCIDNAIMCLLLNYGSSAAAEVVFDLCPFWSIVEMLLKSDFSIPTVIMCLMFSFECLLLKRFGANLGCSGQIICYESNGSSVLGVSFG